MRGHHEASRSVLHERLLAFERTLRTVVGAECELVQQMAELRRDIATEVERQSQLLAGINTAAIRLLRAERWRAEIADILRLLGEASGADRVGVIKIRADNGDRPKADLLYGWDRIDPASAQNPNFQNIDMLAWGFGPMLENFHDAKAFYFHRSERPANQIVADDHQSSLNFPIFVNGAVWGCLIFATTQAEHDWLAAELDALQITASIFGATIERELAEATAIERNRLQLELQHEHELNTTKTQIMRMISHEFRTPLAIIMSSSTLLHNYYERMTINEQHDKLDTIQQQVDQLEYLLERVTEALHESGPQQPFQPIKCNLELICQLHLVEAQAKLGSRHRLQLVSDGTLTEAYVDEYLVHRILTNLLSNAIKYSTDNTEIQLRLSADGDNAIIEVEDQGIGISLKEQTRLFEQFYKTTNAENISGIGLGLSIVRECVERHHGKISVRSEIDRGTTFTVRLPMRAPEAV